MFPNPVIVAAVILLVLLAHAIGVIWLGGKYYTMRSRNDEQRREERK